MEGCKVSSGCADSLAKKIKSSTKKFTKAGTKRHKTPGYYKSKMKMMGRGLK